MNLELLQLPEDSFHLPSNPPQPLGTCDSIHEWAAFVDTAPLTELLAQMRCSQDPK